MKAIERIINEIKSQIIENFESGDLSAASETLWLPSRPMPINAITGRPYSNFLNALNLVFTARKKGFSSHRWVTFNQAKEKGISVRKGEKGTVVLGWFKVKPKTDDPDEYLPLYPKCFNVFNEDQLTEMLPGHQFGPEVLLDTTSAIETVGKVFDQIGVSRIEDPNENYYVPSEDYIAITPITHFVDEAAAISVMLHELSHSTGHPSRLDRKFNNKKSCPEYRRDYGIEEAIAESSAWLVSMYLGLPHRASHSSAYVVGWLGRNIDELDNVLIQAQKASQFLIKAFDVVTKEEKTSSFTDDLKISA